MGYSPGEFATEDGQKLHWELTGGRVVLWDEHETKAILTLDAVNAQQAAFQLSLLQKEMTQALDAQFPAERIIKNTKEVDIVYEGHTIKPGETLRLPMRAKWSPP